MKALTNQLLLKKLFYKILILIICFVKNFSYGCSPFSNPHATSVNVIGNTLQVQWVSNTAWPCSYHLYVEIRCVSNNNLVFSGFTPFCINKPNANSIPYPQIHNINISNLCPGQTYYVRSRELDCGNNDPNGYGSGWSPQYQFTIPGNSTLNFSVSPSTTICLGDCINLSASLTGTCINGPVTYTWSGGLGNGSTVNVCPTSNSVYTVTASAMGSCALIQQTQQITINVDGPPIAGNIIVANSDICYNTSTTLTLNNFQIFNGTISWYYSTSAGGPWNLIPGENSPTLNTGNLTQTTYYQVLVQNYCGQAYSNVAAVNVHPFPNLSFTVNNQCLYDVFNFINTSTISSGTIVQYNWNFGDGNQSWLTNPNHQYSVEGNYVVTLTGTSDYNCISTIQEQVTAFPIPNADFIHTSVCSYDAVQFTDISTVNLPDNIVQWEWNFGDGGSSTLTNPSHQYATDGLYAVELIVTTNNSCKDTIVKYVKVNEVPQASFQTTNVCIYDLAQFNNTTIFNSPENIQYAWDFGDGNNSNFTSPSHLYSNFGTYQVTLTVTSDSGCVDSYSLPIYIAPQPVSNFTTVDTCYNLPASFYDLSILAGNHTIVAWNWDFGVIPAQTSNQQNPFFQYSSDGPYNVTLIVTSDFGCSDTITLPIYRYPLPQPDFSVNEVCEYQQAIFNDLSVINAPSSIVQWNWNFGDNSLDNNQNTQHLYGNCGNYNVTLTITSDMGCTNSIIKSLFIHAQPVADFIADTVCINTPPTQFTDLSTVDCGDVVNAWNWNFNPGISTIQNPTHTFNSDGYHNVQLIAISNFGCSDTVIKPIRIYEKPIADFSASILQQCSQLCTPFSDLSTSATSSIISWQWNFNNGTTSTVQNPSSCFENTSPTNIRTYDIKLIVQNSNGCYDTIIKNSYLTVWPIPIAEFLADPQPTNMYENRITFTNLSIGADSFHWNLGDGTITNEFSPVHLYADTGNYAIVLHVQNEYGCADTTDGIIRIDPVVSIYIPNTFTPNGDGINDLFFLEGFGLTENNFLFMIFDRWGELIYNTFKFEPWNGYYNNQPAKVDTYVYRILVYDIFNRKHEFMGHVNLIR